MTAPASSTLEIAVGLTAAYAGKLALAAIDDATAIWRTVYGLSDGLNYGRYFASGNPLVAYLGAASTIDDMIAQGVSLRQTARQAVSTAVNAGGADAATFAAAVQNMLDLVRQTCTTGQDAIRLLSTLAGFNIVIDGGPDVQGQEILARSVYACTLIRWCAGLALARATADYVPPSQSDAEGVRDAVADILDGLTLEAADLFQDQVADALDAARIAVVRDLTTRGAALSPIVTRTFAANLPDLVVAYRLYQDAGRAGEVAARNDCPHPAFMPLALEVSAQ
jgi:prophage DNA circulation protein